MVIAASHKAKHKYKKPLSLSGSGAYLFSFSGRVVNQADPAGTGKRVLDAGQTFPQEIAGEN